MKFNSKLIHAGWDSDADAEGSILFQFIKQQHINSTIQNMLRIYLV